MKINSSSSKVNFTIKKMLLLTVNGTFPNVTGEVELNESNLSDSKIDLKIAIDGVDTKNAKRDIHLLQEDFFYAEKYPEITFVSSEISKGTNGLVAKGNLTLLGVTKSIEVPFQFKDNKATGSFNLNRMDYKLGKIPAFVAAKDVAISFDCSIN